MSIYLGEQLVSNVGGTSNSSAPMKPSDFLDDTKISADKAYSSSQTEKRLNEVQNTIETGQDSMVKIWQRSIMNATINDSINFTTSEDHSLDKLQIQAYKFVEGENNISQVLNLFNNSDKENFYFNPENGSFDNGMNIKDKYIFNPNLESDGFYSYDINLESYLNIDHIKEDWN